MIDPLQTSAEILLVDDIVENLRLLETVLAGQGYGTRKAINGKLALRSVKAIMPDLILLDINMPDMTGYEVCQQLKADEHTCKIPVIFISALNDAFDKVKAFDVGGVDYISKPFQTEEVLARVSTHIEIANLQKQLEAKTTRQAQQLAEQNQQLVQTNQQLKVQYQTLQEVQLQLVQHEKMAVLGNLMTGIAHEVNNPIGFISGNVKVAREHLQDLLDGLSLYQEYSQLPEAIAEEIADLDLTFVSEDFPKLIASMESGCDRIRHISTALRTFARTDNDVTTEFDVHEGLDSTLLMLKYRLKANEQRPEIVIIKQYGELSAINCYVGQLNQVFMNILANAIDAFDEFNQERSYQDIEANPNQITITTSGVEEQVQVQIQDNGCGMKPETVERIFEQGFTTKEVGKGTGLGMAIAYQIITEKHSGTITCTSEPGQGTIFTITLPL